MRPATSVTADRSKVILGGTRPLARERERFGHAEICLIAVSFGLLVLTCVDSPAVRQLAVVAWLASFAMLALWNLGAALGLYISAVALYSNLYFSGTFALFERPDHPALLILIGSLALLRSRGTTRWSVDGLTLLIVAYLGYGAVNGLLTGTFSNRNVAQFARTFGVPIVLLFLIMQAQPRPKDLWSFFVVLFALAFYSSVVSVLWQFEGLHRFIFPTWLVDPSINRWWDSIRAGGLLMQPGWNGLLLTLCFCLVYLAYQRWVLGPGRALLLMVGGAILVAIYLTYSRGVYLGAMAAITGLFWTNPDRKRSVTARRLALVSLAMMGLVLALAIRPSTLEGRIGKAETVVWRLEIWKVAFNMIPARPLFGFGFQGYGANAADYLGTSGLMRGNIAEREPAVHNLFLNIAVELGLVGLFLYVMLHFQIFLTAARRARDRWGRQGFVWVIVFMGIYYIKGQFGVTQEPTTNAIFYVTLGLLAGLPSMRGFGPEIGRTGAPGPWQRIH